nr:hypothetical protein [uncultured Oscillibacter sp.]
MNPITAIVQRNLLNYVRSKGRVFGALFMSMFMLVMFSFLMKSAMSGLDAPMPYSHFRRDYHERVPGQCQQLLGHSD